LLTGFTCYRDRHICIAALLPLLSMELLLTGAKTIVKFSEAVQLVFELS